MQPYSIFFTASYNFTGNTGVWTKESEYQLFEKIYILPNADAHSGMRAGLAMQLGLQCLH